MSAWTERIEKHAVWSTLASLGPHLDAAIAREGRTSETVASVERIRSALAFIGKRLEGSEPILLTTSPLDGIQAAISNAVAEVQAYTANGNTAHLVNANAQVDAALSNCWQLATPTTSKELGALRKASEAYRDTMASVSEEMQSRLASAQLEVEGLRTSLAALSIDVTSERQRTLQLVAEYQQQFSVAQEKRNTDTAEEARIRRSEFDQEKASLSATSASLVASEKELLDVSQREHTDGLSTLRADFVEKASAFLGQIDERKREVEKLVGVIADLGITSGYQKAARHARYSTWFWQALSVAGMVAFAIIAYRSFIPGGQPLSPLGQPVAHTTSVVSWITVFSKAFVSFSVGAIAAFAATQASRYQSEERRNRIRALQLEALGPFIASLPDEKQQDFRLQIGLQTFGNVERETDEGGKAPTSVLDLLASREVRGFLTDLVKNSRA